MTGRIKIKKTSSDNKLDGFNFALSGIDITGQSLQKIYTTDENGEIFIEDIRIGEYTIFEVSDENSNRYIIPDGQDVTVEFDKTTEVSFHNQLKEIPKTGDISNIILWVSLLTISSLGLITIGILYYKKRKTITK